MKNIKHYIDYTYLKDDSTNEKIIEFCKTAMKNNYFSVCCYPQFVSIAAKTLKNSNVKAITVVGFPTGLESTAEKVAETKQALKDGAEEIDMVMNYKMLKEKKYKKVLDDIKTICEITHNSGALLKVIIESGELTFEETQKACEICTQADVDFVKTSTGKTPIGAELEKVVLMRKILPENIKIKASGGIRTIENMLSFINAGANRIGTSSNV